MFYLFDPRDTSNTKIPYPEAVSPGDVGDAFAKDAGYHNLREYSLKHRFTLAVTNGARIWEWTDGEWSEN